MSQDTEVPRGRRLKRAAGAAAAVAVLIVAQARPAGASASTAGPPTATQTLSTGAYTWHVARSKDDMAAGNKEKDATGPLHGEFPVVGIDGTVQLRRWQWGEVAALSRWVHWTLTELMSLDHAQRRQWVHEVSKTFDGEGG